MAYGFTTNTGGLSETKITYGVDSFTPGYIIYSQVIDMAPEYHSSLADYRTKSIYPNGLGWNIIDLTNIEPTLNNISTTWNGPLSTSISSSNNIPSMSTTNSDGFNGLAYMVVPPLIVRLEPRKFAIKYNPVFWTTNNSYANFWNTSTLNSTAWKSFWKCRINFYGF